MEKVLFHCMKENIFNYKIICNWGKNKIIFCSTLKEISQKTLRNKYAPVIKSELKKHD